MTRAPAPLRPHAPGHLLRELRAVLAEHYRPDGTDERLHLLGDGPVATPAEALARLDALAAELVARMDRAGWASGAAPGAVTSVLAASVPAAEDVLLRAARRRSARRRPHRAAVR